MNLTIVSVTGMIECFPVGTIFKIICRYAYIIVLLWCNPAYLMLDTECNFMTFISTVGIIQHWIRNFKTLN
jgi:hypothetical protein